MIELNKTQTNIVITFQIEGMHNFPAASELFPEVEFLSNPHRHIFHFVCKKQVFHDDRDVEFILFKREIIKYITLRFENKIGVLDFNSMSCEMIARMLFTEFNLTYCSVFEDGENGAEILTTN